MTSFETLKAKLQDRSAVAGIIGLGYVGLPLADTLHEGGLRVLGFDVDPKKMKMLAAGKSYLKHLGGELPLRLSKSDRFEVTTDFGRLAEADVVLVCVPTPLGTHEEPDLTYVLSSARDIGRSLRPGQLIVLESTTYPGTTRNEFLPTLLEAHRGASPEELQSGRDFFVAFSPEREDPGRESLARSTIPKLVGGLDEAAAKLAAELYKIGVESVIEVSSAEVAEAAKILENVFRAVNIALVNELKMILSSMNIDVWEVISAASTKPFGFMPFYPGPGLGGHCIPIDPFYLTWRAKEVGQPTLFIELAGQINRQMPVYVVDRITEALNDDSKPLRGSKILILGLAYKPNVDDTRETPAAEIISLLSDRGADIRYHDPHVPSFPQKRDYSFDLDSVPLNPETLEQADCVVIATDHDAIDWNAVGRHAKLVVDTRNAMSKVDGVSARVVKA